MWSSAQNMKFYSIFSLNNRELQPKDKLLLQVTILGYITWKEWLKPRRQQLQIYPNKIIWNNLQLECGPMPNLMVALPNIGGALCSTPQSLADAHY